MDRRRRLAALVAAALCLVAAHQGRCGAAARPLATSTDTEAVLDVAAAEAPESAASMWAPGGEGAGEGAGALGEGKWLPLPMPMPMPMALPAPASALVGGLRGFPPVFPLAAGGASMPWVPGAPPAFAGLPALVPPFVGATRQEQLSLWASLFNPLQVRPRLPSSLAGETTTAGPAAVPAIASAGNKAAEAETVDVPAAAAGAAQLAEPKWGVFLGNVDRRN